MKIGVVSGGTAEERGASEKNARDITEALSRKGYKVSLISFGQEIMDVLKKEPIDLVFLCVQGKGYGDGTFQGMLEQAGIPFTGSSMRAACLINDKILCKLLFDRCQIATPSWDILGRKDYEDGTYPYEKFGFPFVAKAPTQGGSFGIRLIRNKNELSSIREVFAYDDPILLERYINGKFYTIGFYESKGGLISLPVVEGLDLDLSRKTEAEREGRLISFTGNYGINSEELKGPLADEIRTMARKVFEITQAKGVARVDFMVSKEDGRPYVLEINAVPGLKKTSLMPREAELAGIAYDDMIEDILKSALSAPSDRKGVAYV